MVASPKPVLKKIIVLLVVAALSACGGSGTGGDGVASSDSPQGNSGGVTLSNTYSSPKDLGVGDLLYVDLQETEKLSFEGVDSDAEFTLVLANTASSGSAMAIHLNAELTEAGFALAKAFGVEGVEEEEDRYDEALLQDLGLNDFSAEFHEALRDRDLNLAEANPDYSPYEFSMGKSASESSASISLGEERSFKVLASLSSSSTVEVTATAKCVGSNIAVFMDTRVTSGMLSDPDIQKLCDQFDADAAKEFRLFGQVSDVNGDGKVIALFTPQVNKLGALGGGIITGFFSASDLYANSSSNPSSNHMEILYIMVPDPAGQYGVAISNAFSMSNLLPTVLVHELQHAINFNEHVFISGGRSEDSWLNEGLSHLAEDLLGYNQENPSRYAIYLRNSQLYSLVTRSPGLANRGASYLFLRFLYEQASNGESFVKNLLQNGKTGPANVEAAFGGSEESFNNFGEFVLRWSVALGLTDRGVTADRRFTYHPREKNPSTGNWTGVCLICGAEDNRGTSLNGVSRTLFNGSRYGQTYNSAARFYQLSNVKETLHFNTFNSTQSAYGALIRTK